MRIGRDDNYIEIEKDSEQIFEDANYFVKIESSGFTGSTSAWIPDELARKFVRDLELVSVDRASEAVLQNLSSGRHRNPFELKIAKIDSLGHIAVYATVRHLYIKMEFIGDHSTAVSFELDREHLSDVLLNLRKLFAS